MRKKVPDCGLAKQGCHDAATRSFFAEWSTSPVLVTVGVSGI